MNTALLISCNSCKHFLKGYCLIKKCPTNYDDICNKFGSHFEGMDEK